MRVLILAGGGMLGHKVWITLSKEFKEVYVTLRRSRAEYQKFGIFNSERAIFDLDLTDLSAMQKILDQLRPDIIVNCAGVTPRSKYGEDVVANIKINALLPNYLLIWAKKSGAKVYQFSTVCVFDGRKGNYAEEIIPNAFDLYGRTKILGELIDKNAITIRSSFIGRELENKTELLEWFLAQDGGKIKGYRQAIFTGVTTNVMANIVFFLITKMPNLFGLFHVSSEKMSKYQLLILMKKSFNIDVEIEADDKFVCKRDLNDDKFRRATAFKTPSWKEMMEEMVKEKLCQEK